jgi:hypothetical protein
MRAHPAYAGYLASRETSAAMASNQILSNYLLQGNATDFAKGSTDESKGYLLKGEDCAMVVARLTISVRKSLIFILSRYYYLPVKIVLMRFY